MTRLLRRACLVVSLSAAAALAGCGGDSGSCVVPSPVHTPSWDACHDGWTAAECSSRGGTESSSSCAAQGFTVACPADGSNTYRRSTYTC
jgi:hypothetical protein